MLRHLSTERLVECGNELTDECRYDRKGNLGWQMEKIRNKNLPTVDADDFIGDFDGLVVRNVAFRFLGLVSIFAVLS